MIPDAEETIVAIGSAPGGAPRGIVRLAGPDAVSVVERLADRKFGLKRAGRIASVPIQVELANTQRLVSCDLFIWPDERSYTQQPAVELHAIGSLPLLEAIVRSVINAGARLATPGEFTLRAFLAGRIDLTQAEAVLAVIDARHDDLLELALGQLAGGLSGPLNQLREDLLTLLADLEAGLDFVEEEDVQFVETSVLIDRLQHAETLVREAEQKTEQRHIASARPMVLLAGPPNVGKSRLFNVLVSRCGSSSEKTEALVADQPGVTRDSLSTEVTFDGIDCMLADSAGVALDASNVGPIDEIAQQRVSQVNNQADIVLNCRVAGDWILEDSAEQSEATLRVATMADKLPATFVLPKASSVCITSAETEVGIELLVRRISESLSESEQASASQVVAQTASRCRESLVEAGQALQRAKQTAQVSGGDELVSLELRVSLDALGRVVGAIVTDDVLDQIFSKFCIGK